ncbi:MAG: hypothetical protein J6D34_05930 [Atopobiaceae bacterium]|nr:hypothetical protein [Atopobiaceae bacterium]
MVRNAFRHACSFIMAAFATGCLLSTLPPTIVYARASANGADAVSKRLEDLTQKYQYENPYPELREQANLSYDGVSQEDTREIVCWGDSMTEGYGATEGSVETSDGTYDISYKAYPQVLQELTGLKTYNFGVPGATSEEIALMQGAYTLDRLRNPLRVFDAHIASQGEAHPGDILILEMGSNGGWSNKYKRLIKQYRFMIEHSGCRDFLIVGDTDDPGTSIGDLNQQEFSYGDGPGETDWEAALREAFGDRFINMRVYLIESGLSNCNMQETDADRRMAASGCISTRLRSDWTHFNAYGYYAKAVGIYERGVDLGFWGPDHKESLESALLP